MSEVITHDPSLFTLIYNTCRKFNTHVTMVISLTLSFLNHSITIAFTIRQSAGDIVVFPNLALRKDNLCRTHTRGRRGSYNSVFRPRSSLTKPSHSSGQGERNV